MAGGRTKSENNRNNKGRRWSALVVFALIICGLVWFALSGNLDKWINGDTEGAPDGNTITGTGGDAEGDDLPDGYAVGAADDNDIADIDILDIDDLPAYDGHHYVTVNGSVPVFDDAVYETAGLVLKNGRWKTDGTLLGIDSRKVNTFESYGPLDGLGRCTGAVGCLGEETMPLSGESRGDISSVHPSGWAKAQNWERCHLIAWALSAENANECNLITGTHYLNYDGMRPLEEEVEQYIWDTGNHVLYEARPIFFGDELVARGVQMKAWSVEDEGSGISFNVYCFNVTPGAMIDYVTGIVTTAEQAQQEARLYVINTKSGVFHYPTCEGAQQIHESNRLEVTATRLELTAQGYTPCGYCEP